jgi:hypothetical protein
VNAYDSGITCIELTFHKRYVLRSINQVLIKMQRKRAMMSRQYSATSVLYELLGILPMFDKRLYRQNPQAMLLGDPNELG